MAAAATVSASPPVSAENHQQPLIQPQIQQQHQQRHESQQLQLQMLQMRQERHYLLQQQHHYQTRDQREPHQPHQPLLLQQQQAQHGLTGVLLHQYQLLLSQKQHDARQQQQQQQLHALQTSGVDPESEEGDILETQESCFAGISTREMIPQQHQLQQILERQHQKRQLQQQLQVHINDEDEEQDPDHSASSVIVILPDNSLRLFHQPLLLACDVLAEFPNHFLIHALSSLDSVTCLTEEGPSHDPSLPNPWSAAPASDSIGRSAASTWLQRVHPEDVLSCGATYALVELPPTAPGGASALTSATSSNASSPHSTRAADPRLERSHSETRTKAPPSGSGPLVPRRCTSSSNADLERGFEFPSSAPYIPLSSSPSYVPHVSSSSIPHLSSSLPRDGFPFYAHPSWASESERAAASSIFSIEPESTSMAGGSTRKPPRPRPDGSRSPLGLHLGAAGGGGGGHRRRFSAHEVSPEWIGGGVGGNGGVASSPHEGSLHAGAMHLGGSARWGSGEGGGVSGGAGGGGGGSGPQQPDFSRLLRPLQEPNHLDAQQQHQNMGQKQAQQQRQLLQQPRPGSPANLDAPSGIDPQSAAKSSGRVFSKVVSSVNSMFSRSGNSVASSSSASRLSPSAAPSSSSSSSSLKSAASFLGNRLSRKSSKSSSSLQKHQMFVTMSDPCLAASATLHMPMPMPTELSVELLAPRPSASSSRPPSSLRPGEGGYAPNHQPW